MSVGLTLLCELLAADSDYLAHGGLASVGCHRFIPEVGHQRRALTECHLVIEEPGC